MTSISTVTKQLLTNKNQTNQAGHKHKETFSNKASCSLKWQRDVWLFPFRRVKKCLQQAVKEVIGLWGFALVLILLIRAMVNSLTSRNGLNARAYCLFPSTPTQQIQAREGRQSLTKSQTLFPIEGWERTSSCYNELWWDTAAPRQRRAAAGLCCFWEGSFSFLSLLKPHWYQEGNSSENSTDML